MRNIIVRALALVPALLFCATATGYAAHEVRLAASFAVKVHPSVYVSDPVRGAVDIYLQAGRDQSPIAELRGLGWPDGMCADDKSVYIVERALD